MPRTEARLLRARGLCAVLVWLAGSGAGLALASGSPTPTPAILCEQHPEVRQEGRRKALGKKHGLRAQLTLDMSLEPTPPPDPLLQPDDLPPVPEAAVLGGRTCSEAYGSAFDAVGAILYRETAHCTGTLIRSDVVLTAAHCVYLHDPTKMEFVIGRDVSDTQHTRRARVLEEIHHPRYDAGHLGVNDIALLRLETPLEGGGLEPLDYRDEPLTHQRRQSLIFLGYGAFKQGEPADRRCLPMPLEDFCDESFSYKVPSRNTCNGDSGGPALELVMGKYRIAGITAYGDKACVEYGIDMDIGAYAQWISDSMRRLPTPVPLPPTPTQIPLPLNATPLRIVPTAVGPGDQDPDGA